MLINLSFCWLCDFLETDTAHPWIEPVSLACKDHETVFTLHLSHSANDNQSHTTTSMETNLALGIMDHRGCDNDTKSVAVVNLFMIKSELWL